MIFTPKNLAREIQTRSEQCERGILGVAMTPDGQQGIGLAVIGPDCVVYSTLIFPFPPIDVVLN
jgi:hypothetical protein